MRTGCPQDIQGVTSSVLLFVFQHTIIVIISIVVHSFVAAIVIGNVLDHVVVTATAESSSIIKMVPNTCTP